MRHIAAVLVCALVALPSARAQRPEDAHNMPMGMGSDFAPPPMPLGGHPGIGDERRAAGSAEAVRELERRGSLDDATRKIPDVTGAQKDSVRALEKRYGQSFRSYAVLLKSTFDASRSAGRAPELRALGLLRLTADSTRTAELTAARALLATDEQRGVFDRNVADLRAREAKRDEQLFSARP